MDIIRRIQRQSEGTWTPSPGSIYYLLSELASHGEIRQVVPAERGEKRYLITPLGLQQLEASTSSLRSEMHRIIAALALALPEDEIGRLLLRIIRLVLETPSRRGPISDLLTDCANKLAQVT